MSEYATHSELNVFAFTVRTLYVNCDFEGAFEGDAVIKRVVVDEGTVVEGTVVEGAVVEGTVVEGTVVEGTAVEGAIVGAIVEGAVVVGPADGANLYPSMPVN